jgi:hypothetical protein
MSTQVKAHFCSTFLTLTEPLEVANASVNADHTILVFTTVASFRDSRALRFNTYHVDVGSSKPMKSLSDPSSTHTRVQFLDSSRMLAFRHNSRIDLFTFQAGKHVLRQIHTNFVWYQFDLQRMALYLCYNNHKDASRDTDQPQYRLALLFFSLLLLVYSLAMFVFSFCSDSRLA